jgi:two-component system response regulator NreC
MDKLKILIVDDHAIVRAGLRSLLESQDDIEVVGEAESGEEAIEKAGELDPSLVLMDIAMPGIGGIEATRQIKLAQNDTLVLILTMHDDEEFAFPVIRAGASGYVMKQAAPRELLYAIRTCGAGYTFLSSNVTKSLLEAYAVTQMEKETYSSLSDREKEVIDLASTGLKNREIADTLFLSVRTVEKHRQSAMRKLGLSGQEELAIYAVRKSIVRTNS